MHYAAGITEPDDFMMNLCLALRTSRRRQKLTQAEVVARTGGLVTKAALANYETGHRPIRVEVLWVVARALGEKIDDLVSAAERGAVQRTEPSPGVPGGERPHTPDRLKVQSQPRVSADSGPITVRVSAVQASDDPWLRLVQAWIETVLAGRKTTDFTVDTTAITGLALLLHATESQVRERLSRVAMAASAPRR